MDINELKSEGYTDITNIKGKGLCGIMRFAFTTGLVYGLDEFGYVGRYCYPTYTNALNALNALRIWDGIGDPKDNNWIKHKGFNADYSNPCPL